MLENRNGMEVDVNYSLLPDGIVPGGDVWRNAAPAALAMYSSGAVTPARAVLSKAAFVDTPSYATDAYEGFSVMDVGDFEDLSEQVRNWRHHATPTPPAHAPHAPPVNR